MKFNLDDLNPGVWIDIDEKDPSKGSICLRVVNSEKLRQIHKSTTERKFRYHKGKMHEYYNVDDDKADELLWDYCIVDWKDIVDADDKPIACTKDNKTKLMRGSVVFRNIINDALDKVRVAFNEYAENAQKN